MQPAQPVNTSELATFLVREYVTLVTRACRAAVRDLLDSLGPGFSHAVIVAEAEFGIDSNTLRPSLSAIEDGYLRVAKRVIKLQRQVSRTAVAELPGTHEIDVTHGLDSTAESIQAKIAELEPAVLNTLSTMLNFKAISEQIPSDGEHNSSNLEAFSDLFNRFQCIEQDIKNVPNVTRLTNFCLRTSYTMS